MQVTEIVVSAGRTFNHPYEQYSNLKPHVTVKASLSEGEDFQAAIKELQSVAEGLVEDHKRNLLASIEELQEMSRRQQEVTRLESTIRRAQQDLDRLRESYKGQQQLPLVKVDTYEPQAEPYDAYDGEPIVPPPFPHPQEL